MAINSILKGIFNTFSHSFEGRINAPNEFFTQFDLAAPQKIKIKSIKAKHS